jgi:hypothetical protein
MPPWKVQAMCSEGSVQRTHQVRDNVTILCHTEEDQEVEWRYIPEIGGQRDASIVYSNGIIYKGFHERFSVTKDDAEPNVVNLVINDVEPVDAGLYLCTENEGLGMTHKTCLVINAAVTTTKVSVPNRSFDARVINEPEMATVANIVHAEVTAQSFILIFLLAMCCLMVILAILHFIVKRKWQHFL